MRELDEKETEGVHSGAISKALLQHTKSRCQDLTQALDAANAGMRLEVVRELRVLLHALVEHSTKLLQGSGLPGSGLRGGFEGQLFNPKTRTEGPKSLKWWQVGRWRRERMSGKPSASTPSPLGDPSRL